MREEAAQRYVETLHPDEQQTEDPNIPQVMRG